MSGCDNEKDKDKNIDGVVFGDGHYSKDNEKGVTLSLGKAKDVRN